MCVIYYAKDKKTLLDKADLPASAQANKHGCGVMYSDKSDGRIVIAKSAKSDDFTALLAEVPDKTELAIHFRHATSGKQNTDNAHPFGLEVSGAALMHNGIVSGWGDAERSDTRMICEDVLGKLPWTESLERAIEDLFNGSRTITVCPSTCKRGLWLRTGNWYEGGFSWRKGEDFAQSSYVSGSSKSSSNYQSCGTGGTSNTFNLGIQYGHDGIAKCGCRMVTKESRKQWQQNKDSKSPDLQAYSNRPWCYSGMDFDTWFKQIAPALKTRMETEAPREGEQHHAWVMATGSTAKDWNSWLNRPLSLSLWGFAAWWGVYKSDPDGEKIALPRASTTVAAPYAQGLAAINETVTKGVTVPPVVPIEAPASEDEAWEKGVKPILERGAAEAKQQAVTQAEVKAAMDAQRDIGGDTTLRGTVSPITRADFDDDFTESELGEIAALQAEGDFGTASDTPLPDMDSNCPVPQSCRAPWEVDNFVNVDRWCAKYPHRAAKHIKALTDGVTELSRALTSLRNAVEASKPVAPPVVAPTAPKVEERAPLSLSDGTMLT